MYSDAIRAIRARPTDMTSKRIAGSSPPGVCMCVNKAKGSVRVSPGMFETKVIVAPNSPRLRANPKIAPTSIPGEIIGIVIVKKTLEGLKSIYRPGYRYKKAGVIMLDLHPESNIQGLFELNKERSNSLMKSFDFINSRYGSATIYTAAEGIDKSWSMQRQKISPCYTTRFSELLKVQI